MTIYKGYFKSPLGNIAISVTDSYVTALDFTSQSDIPSDDHPLLTQVIQQLDAYFKGHLTQFDLPVLPEGTAFQLKAWQVLQTIPYGQTFSYKQQAIALGNPNASRAVGKANSKNPISIIVPCHRVIGSDKSLTGYAGGLDRKKALLDHEAKVMELKN